MVRVPVHRRRDAADCNGRPSSFSHPEETALRPPCGSVLKTAMFLDENNSLPREIRSVLEERGREDETTKAVTQSR